MNRVEQVLKDMEHCRNMVNVANRLRASKIECDKSAYMRGQWLGRDWAEQYAEADSLETLASVQDDLTFECICHVAYFLDKEHEELVGEDISNVDFTSAAFASGFVDGVVSVYDEHSDLLFGIA